MKQNEEILKERTNILNSMKGPRVGDWLIRKDGKYTRLTHDWGEPGIQDGGENGSFYLGNYGCSYSGGLDPLVKKDKIEITKEIKDGSVWFFNNDQSRAHNGARFKVPFRVYKYK